MVGFNARESGKQTVTENKPQGKGVECLKEGKARSSKKQKS
jgi:hypothetical protein